MSPRTASSGLAKLKSISQNATAVRESALPPSGTEASRVGHDRRGSSGLPVTPRGGRRKVLYLQDDVLRTLEQLQREAEAEGWRLTQSSIVDHAVRALVAEEHHS